MSFVNPSVSICGLWNKAPNFCHPRHSLPSSRHFALEPPTPWFVVFLLLLWLERPFFFYLLGLHVDLVNTDLFSKAWPQGHLLCVAFTLIYCYSKCFLHATCPLILQMSTFPLLITLTSVSSVCNRYLIMGWVGGWKIESWSSFSPSDWQWPSEPHCL